MNLPANIELIAVVSGAASVAGLVLGIAAVIGTSRPPGPGRVAGGPLVRLLRGSSDRPADRRRHQALLIGAVAAGAVAFLITGLPVVGILVGVAVPGVPWLFTVGRAEQRTIARIEAVGEWTRRLKDVSSTGQGLQQAITGTVATAPAEIDEEVRLLAARLHAGWHAPGRPARVRGRHRRPGLRPGRRGADPAPHRPRGAARRRARVDRRRGRRRGGHPARGRGQAHPAPLRGAVPHRHDAADVGLRTGQPRVHAAVRHAARPARDDRPQWSVHRSCWSGSAR